MFLLFILVNRKKKDRQQFISIHTHTNPLINVTTPLTFKINSCKKRTIVSCDIPFNFIFFCRRMFHSKNVIFSYFRASCLKKNISSLLQKVLCVKSTDSMYGSVLSEEWKRWYIVGCVRIYLAIHQGIQKGLLGVAFLNSWVKISMFCPFCPV